MRDKRANYGVLLPNHHAPPSIAFLLLIKLQSK